MTQSFASDDDALEALVGQIADEFSDRCNRGEQPSVEEYADRYPTIASILLEILPALQILKPAVEPLADQTVVHTKPDPACNTPQLGDTPGAGTRRGDLPATAGRYVVEEKIGEGGMGAVLRVRDPDFERTLAVKVMLDKGTRQPAAERRFLEEAKLTGQLQHPGIPPVHELGRMENGLPFFAMKLVKGETLAEVLKGNREPGTTGNRKSNSEKDDAHSRLIGIFGHVCQTIGYAHKNGFIHRDLKPSNIMVGAFGEVQVMDWGLAKRMKDKGGRMKNGEAEIHPSTFNIYPSETVDGTVMGTPAYMSPEQARGEISTLDERSDVFGLGAILCEILTGKPAFQGDSALEVVKLANSGNLSEAFARLDGCGADVELVALTKGCLAPAKEERPADAGAVASAIEHYESALRERLRRAELEKAQATIQAAEETKRLRVERQRRRMTTVAAMATLLLFAGAAGAGMWYQQVQRERALAQLARENKAMNINTEIVAALKHAANSHDSLHEHLGNQSSAWKLQSNIEDWDRLIESQTTAVRQANLLAASDPDLVQSDKRKRLDEARRQLQADTDDWKFAKELDEIRAAATTWTERKFNYTIAAPLYEKTFRAASLDVQALPPADSAELIKRSPIRYVLVAALDHWADSLGPIRDKNRNELALLTAIARRADPQPWRDHFRRVEIWGDPDELLDLTYAVDVKDQSPSIIASLASRLKDKPARQNLLRNALVHHPGDFWLSLVAGNASDDPDESAARFQAALATRPKSSAAWNNLALILHEKKSLPDAFVAVQNAIACNENNCVAWTTLGALRFDKNDVPGAVQAIEKALEINPKYAKGWNNLGYVRQTQDDLAGAVAAYNTALKFDSRLVQAWRNLAEIRRAQNDTPAAMIAYKKALAADPHNAETWTNFGVFLRDENDTDGALQAFKRAVAADPKLGIAHANLGHSLHKLGRFRAAVETLEKALKMLPPKDQRRTEVEAQCRFSRQLLEIEKRLPAVLNGDKTNFKEQINLALLCQGYLKRFADAARLYTEALKNPPAKITAAKLIKHRFDTARCAVLAASGKGHNGDKITADEKQRFFDMAHRLLQSELHTWQRRLKANVLLAMTIADQMRQWQHDDNLASTRNLKQGASLKETQRQAWEQLWRDVEALRKQARNSYRETKINGELTAAQREHKIKLSVNTQCVIDLESSQFDTVLRLTDVMGTKVGENDNSRAGTTNSRLIIRTKRGGDYILVVTSKADNGRGRYLITIREFTQPTLGAVESSSIQTKTFDKHQARNSISEKAVLYESYNSVANSMLEIRGIGCRTICAALPRVKRHRTKQT